MGGFISIRTAPDPPSGLQVQQVIHTESEVDAAAILLPIPISRRIEAFATTDLDCWGSLYDRARVGFLVGNRCARGLGLASFGMAWLGMQKGLTYDRRIHSPASLSPTPMPHNPNHTLQTDFALADHAVLALKGPDAVAFAQAQFMNDVGALGNGQWQWNGWLTPKGRLIALFALIRLDAGTLWLLLPDVGANELAPLLQRYVFRSKVVIAAEDRVIAGSFNPPLSASDATSSVLDDGCTELDMSGDAGPRSLRIGGLAAREDAAATARWARSDIAHGLPRLPASQREQWTPQQLSLDRLRAFSVKKGCYPGQEIVARTHYLGQVKRGLMRLQGAGIGELVEVMTDEPTKPATASVRPIGQVVCAAGDEGLAVMPLDAGDGPFATGNLPCSRLPLLAGLAR